MLEESIFSHLMILVGVTLLAGFIQLMEFINKRLIEDEK
ncbi:hypothetical protein IE1_05628 [Bacillus cereus BAG3O-2]|nr:hypothetical protein IE1_05628 [Bacillus cereus BAG3O-2]EJQ18360.1 hypothetical protein IE7_05595 [Bacillus cereus BAG4O-1]